MKIQEKKQLVENTPWDLLTEDRFGEFPYSGLLIKVFRVTKSWNARMLGQRLGLRASTISRLETKDKVSIKLAKKLAHEFDIPDYRIFRQKDRLDPFIPSPEAKQALIETKEWFEKEQIFLIKASHSLTDSGSESLKVQVRTRKRKFPEDTNGFPLDVEVESTSNNIKRS